MAEEASKAFKSEVKTMKVGDYEFSADTDLLDDVEAFELIDKIESNGQVSAIVPLLKFLIGADGYEKMKAHFVKSEGRFRMTRLSDVYKVIIENFDPKDSR